MKNETSFRTCVLVSLGAILAGGWLQDSSIETQGKTIALLADRIEAQSLQIKLLERQRRMKVLPHRVEVLELPAKVEGWGEYGECWMLGADVLEKR